MIENASVQPMLPVMRGPDQSPVGLLEVLRWRVLAPSQCDVDLLALLHAVARGRAGTLEAQAQVGPQSQLEVAALGTGDAVVIAETAVLRACRRP